MLDRVFDAAGLHVLREQVLDAAAAAGLSAARAVDVMLTVHELAANVVLHGPGSGRVRMETDGTHLRCEVSDSGRARAQGATRGGGPPWPFQRGHGLWLAREAAASLSITSGPGNTHVTALFPL